MKIKSLIVVSVLFFSVAMIAQNETELWKKVMHNYNCENYSMDIQVKMIPQGNAQAVAYSGSVKRAGNCLYTSMQGITTIIGKKYNLGINENSKTISYAEPEDRFKGRKDAKSDVEKAIEAVGKNTPKVKSKAGKEIVYEISFEEDPFYSTSEITVNASSFTIVKIVYHFKKEKDEDQQYLRAEINYSNIALNTKPDEKWFNETQYITVGKNKVTGFGKFASYKLIDQKNLISSYYGK